MSEQLKEKLKDVGIRALKTFVQATLASFVVVIPEFIELIPNWSAIQPLLISACVGALAAGFSAVYNGVIKPVMDKLNKKTTQKKIVDNLTDKITESLTEAFSQRGETEAKSEDEGDVSNEGK